MFHAAVVVAIEFEKYISTFESLLGKYDSTVADQIHKDPHVADLMLQAMEGEQNLMIFWKLNHGGSFPWLASLVRQCGIPSGIRG